MSSLVIGIFLDFCGEKSSLVKISYLPKIFKEIFSFSFILTIQFILVFLNSLSSLKVGEIESFRTLL